MKGLRPLAALVALLAVTGCKDSGLPGMNLPLQVAEHKPTPYILYTSGAIQGQPDLREVDGEHWLVGGGEEQIPDALMAAIGTGQGAQLHALAWDTPPHDRLYERVGQDRYRVLARAPRVDPAAGAAAREAARDAPTGH